MKKILMTIVCCLTMMATYAQGQQITKTDAGWQLVTLAFTKKM